MNRFLELYNLAPDVIKMEIDKTKNVFQSPFYHPEGDVYRHTMIVTNRLFNTYNNIHLDFCGLFHDLGKIYTTEEDIVNKTFHSYDHEIVSCEIIMNDDFRYWIRSFHGNIDIIHFVIENHMRIKFLSEMRRSKRITLLNHEYFRYLFCFMTADYGGDNPECRKLTLSEYLNIPYDTKIF
jgi:hypothetical protein